MPGPSRTIQVPFHIGSDGGIAYTVDRVEQAAQQLLAVATTNPGERVMRPNYGVPISALLFEPNDPLVLNEMRARLSAAFKTWVPGVEVIAIDTAESSTTEGLVLFQISFQLPGTTDIYTAVIHVGGTVEDFVLSI